jgi:hypothetical protein
MINFTEKGISESDIEIIVEKRLKKHGQWRG